jgi:hypothetical protein
MRDIYACKILNLKGKCDDMLPSGGSNYSPVTVQWDPAKCKKNT